MKDDNTWARKPKNTTFIEYVKKLFDERSQRSEEFDRAVKLYGMQEIERIVEGRKLPTNEELQKKEL